MDIYMAAVYTNKYMTDQQRYSKLNEVEQAAVRSVPHILESYHYINRQSYVDEMRAGNAKVFLDSGAFSAHSLGAHISLIDYCNYIHRNSDILRYDDGNVMASVLDGIGDPLQTYRNQLEMEARGVRPLPCFHYGEDFKYLEYYMKHYEYITIGGMVGRSTEQLTVWLDRMWDKYICDGSGRPKTKLHAFGITSVGIMERYPWYSCDSSSWIQAAAFGNIIMSKWGVVPISEKSPARHDAGRHIGSLTPIEQDAIFKLLEDAGFTYERLSTVYESRAAYNLWSYGVISATINAATDNRFKHRVQELF